jgi:hypothetical protein
MTRRRPDGALRFPRRVAISARLSVEDVPSIYSRARREMATLLRGLAEANHEPARTILGQAADLFEEGLEEPPARVHGAAPLKPRT